MQRKRGRSQLQKSKNKIFTRKMIEYVKEKEEHKNIETIIRNENLDKNANMNKIQQITTRRKKKKRNLTKISQKKTQKSQNATKTKN